MYFVNFETLEYMELVQPKVILVLLILVVIIYI